MKTDEMAGMAIDNLKKSKLRTVLTTLGVVIGIGALVSMVSFGTGMQKNVTAAFLENDLFTSLQVLPDKVSIDDVMREGPQEALRDAAPDSVPLDKAALATIRSLPNVVIAFPESRFPVKVLLDGRETTTQARVMPAAMGRFKPFDKLQAGRFYAEDTARAAIVSPRLLRELKIQIIDPGKPRAVSLEDSLKGFRSARVEALIGRKIELVTSNVDFRRLMQNPFSMMTGPSALPVTQTSTPFRIAGITKQANGFEQGMFESGLILPTASAEALPRLNFSNAWDLLNQRTGEESYGSVYVRVAKMQDLPAVQAAIDTLGFGVISVADQLDSFKKGFVIFDTLLGAVGTIALVVASLGIINTMVMSILERTREIGIMKAVGADENDIKGIFFVEAGVIGFLGGVFGLGLGWLVTRIANAIANIYIAKQGGGHADLFYIPPWLILGAMGFSILVSLLAGLYPAVRAARVNPVEALRHD
jgi:putative ABC transport system permease protein